MSHRLPNDWIIFGHRGACAQAPENTLTAIQKALDLGVNGIEVDVQWIDQQLILLHDQTLERTTNGTGLVQNYRFSQLRELDAGDGEHIPTLEEATQLIYKMNPDTVFNIELKGRNTGSPVARCLFENNCPRILISSFSERELRAFREVDIKTPVGLLLSGTFRKKIKLALELNIAALHCSLSYFKANREAMRETADAYRWKIFVYTVNSPKDAQWLRDHGAHGVFSDLPVDFLSEGTDS